MSYAGLQKGFFYDRRVGNLEGQVMHVFQNKDEFNFTEEEAFKRVQELPQTKAFLQAHFAEEDQVPALMKVAIATYVRSLSDFNSKFDRNMQGKEKSLSAQEIRGFNLFMGKASCGTCHFAPLFNGTLPTRFKESELENIGVPATASNETLDDDLGRFDVFKTEARKHFFKTPSIRNSQLTAPYMHNGVYNTLEEVMTFYNAGGGAGMGLDVPHQTLPADSLGLDEQEIGAIIAFMQTLTDQQYEKDTLTTYEPISLR